MFFFCILELCKEILYTVRFGLNVHSGVVRVCEFG